MRLSTVLVDRAAFECLGGFHEDFHVACDYLFAIRLSLRASFALDPEALVDYRIHDRNTNPVVTKINPAVEDERATTCKRHEGSEPLQPRPKPVHRHVVSTGTKAEQ